MHNVDTKEILADICVHVKTEVNGNVNVTVWYNTTHTQPARRLLNSTFPETINGYNVKDRNCTLTVTRFGDMSSFVGHPRNIPSGTFNASSTGYVTIDQQNTSAAVVSEGGIEFIDIVDEFPCQGAANGSLPLNKTAFLSTNLGEYAGRGLLLKLSGTDDIIGFSVIKYDDGLPKANVVVEDVTAVC